MILLFFYLFVHVVNFTDIFASLQFKTYGSSLALMMPSVLQTLAHKTGFSLSPRRCPRRLDRRKASRVLAVGETRDEEALFGAS